MVKYVVLEVLECFFFWFSARLCANGDLSTNSPIKSAALQDFIVAGYCFASSVLPILPWRAHLKLLFKCY